MLLLAALVGLLPVAVAQVAVPGVGTAGTANARSESEFRDLDVDHARAVLLGEQPWEPWFGRRVDGDIFVEDGELAGPLIFKNGEIVGSVTLNASTMPGRVVIENTVVHGSLNIIGSVVTGSVRLTGSTFASVDLTSTDVTKSVELDDARIRGSASMNGATIGGSLQLDRGCFEALSLISTAIGIDFQADGALFTEVPDAGPLDESCAARAACDDANAISGELELNAATIAGSVFLRSFPPDVAEGDSPARRGCFQAVDATNANVGTSVVVSRSTIRDSLTLDGATVSGPVQLWNDSEFGGDVLLGGIFTDGTVNLDGSTFMGDVDLAGARVARSLRLGSENLPMWNESPESLLDLTGARIGSIIDSVECGHDGADQADDSTTTPDDRSGQGSTPTTQDTEWCAWPPRLLLEGFTYQAVSTDSGFLRRSSNWYRGWLELDRSKSAQPSKQLEASLRTAGQAGVADDLAISRLDSSLRDRSWLVMPLWVLWRASAGYGYAPELFILWILFFVAAGAVIARFGIDERSRRVLGLGNGIGDALAYSLARATPFTRSSSTERVHLMRPLVPPWVRAYFVLHSLVGYLAPFLLATLIARLFSP